MLSFQNSPLLHQWLKVAGLTVFHTAWLGGLLLLLLMLVLKIIPARRANQRFAVAGVALLLLLFLFVAIFYQQWNRTEDRDALSQTQLALPVSTSAAPVLLPPSPVSVDPSVNVSSAPAADGWTLLSRWAPVGAAFWLLGCVFQAIRLLRGLQCTQRLKSQAQPLAGNWERQFRRLAQQAGTNKSIAFLQSYQTSVPLTFGWLKPVVLVPVGLFSQLSPEQVEMVILHELAHIRRHDYLWTLGQSVAEIILFYHPAYWYIARVLEREREFACDQMTVRVTRQPHIYARTLVEIASATSTAVGLAASGKGDLSVRIQRIVAPAYGRQNVQLAPVLALVSLLGLASVAYAWQSRQPLNSLPSGLHQTAIDSTDADYGPLFEEVISQVPDEVLDTTNSTIATASPTMSQPTYLPDSSRNDRNQYLHDNRGSINLQTPPKKTKSTDRWLYVLNGQVQTSRPALLDQDYRANGWETRVIQGASWWIKDHLAEEQQASVEEYRYTGIVFITSQKYRAAQPAHLVHGKVVAGSDELPVPDITVRVKGQGISTTTDANGYYELAATHWQDTIEFLTRYYTTEVPISGRRDVSLFTYETDDSWQKRKRQRMQKTLKNMEQRVQLGSNLEKSPARPSKDSSAANTLFIVDGALQPDNITWEDLSLKVQEIQSVEVLTPREGAYQYYRTLSSFVKSKDGFEVEKAESPETIKEQQKTWKAQGYEKVVLINTWGKSTTDKITNPINFDEPIHIFPNPARQQFALQFQMETNTQVVIAVLNDQGQLLSTLTDQTYPAGSHEVNWDASEQKAGIYFVQWTVGKLQVTRKVVIE